MKQRVSQKDKVIRELRVYGFCTRNWALRQFISRLGAIICVLKKEGMNITAEFRDGDYVYKLMDKPKSTIVYRVNGEIVHTKVIY